MKDICIYFLPMYFLPHYPLDMVEIFFANKYNTRGGKIISRRGYFFLHHQIFAIPVPVCSILERRQGFIHFFVYFPPHRRMWSSFFTATFFLCFHAVFFCYSLASSIATVNENECISHKTIFSRFCHFQCEKIFC